MVNEERAENTDGPIAEAISHVMEVRPVEPSAGEITDILSLNTVVRDLSDGEKMELHQRYKAGDLSELAAGILLGESIESIENEKQAFREAMEMDRSGVFKKLDQ